MDDSIDAYYIGEPEPYTAKEYTLKKAHTRAHLISQRHRICCVWRKYEPLIPEAIYVRGMLYVKQSSEQMR
jgi:hypothetical protein